MHLDEQVKAVMSGTGRSMAPTILLVAQIYDICGLLLSPNLQVHGSLLAEAS